MHHNRCEQIDSDFRMGHAAFGAVVDGPEVRLQPEVYGAQQERNQRHQSQVCEWGLETEAARQSL